MLISTRGRYALRVMIDLAEIGKDTYVPMKTIAERQGISLKYLERIIPVLKKNGIVEGVQGKGGGYRLCRKPQEYKVGEILRLTEGGSMAPVQCLSCDATPCERRGECRTIAMWNELSHLINDYLDNITIADLMRKSDQQCPVEESAQGPHPKYAKNADMSINSVNVKGKCHLL